jgi:hypothetical protein
LPLRGNPPEDSNSYDLSSLSKAAVSRAYALAATPPDFSSHYHHTRNAGRTADTTTSRSSRNDHDDPREAYWKNNHPGNKQYHWGSIVGQFPVIAPITEEVKIKNDIFNMHTDKTEKVTGNWTEKTDFFTAAFEDVVPAAYLQSSMAIGDLDSMELPVYTFADMEILDSNLTVIPQGNGLDYSPQARERTRFLCFTLTVHPRLITPGATNVDPQSFPLPTSVTVYVRALLDNGIITLAITKDLLEQHPKTLLMIYAQGQQAFDIAIKERNIRTRPRQVPDLVTRNQGQDKILCHKALHQRIIRGTIRRHQDTGTMTGSHQTMTLQ